MKRVRDFLIAFLFVMIVSYALPIFLPHTSSSMKDKEVNHEQSLGKEPSFIQGTLPASGYSKWIGQSAKKFSQQFGKPNDKYAISQTHEWWSYGEDATDYYQVLVVNDKVESILVVGKQVETDGLRPGMGMDELTMVTTLYSNFSFEYHRENYIIELSEEDMNYQPLLAFENGTFAIVHFSQMTGKIIAIRYLSSLDLLTLMPYQLLSGNLLDIGDSLFNSAEIDEKQRTHHFVTLLNILRQSDQLELVTPSTELDQLASEFAQQFLMKQDQVLSENRFEAMLEERENHTYEWAFYLDADEVMALKQLTGTSQTDLSVLLYMPSQDTSFVAMNAYGELAYLLPLDDEDVNQIGVAFKDDFIVVLLKL